MSQVFGAFFAGLAAWYLAEAAGVPVWRNWPAGDRVDIAMLVFFAALLLSHRP